jgi:hypothetical protein
MSILFGAGNFAANPQQARMTRRSLFPFRRPQAPERPAPDFCNQQVVSPPVYFNRKSPRQDTVSEQAAKRVGWKR